MKNLLVTALACVCVLTALPLHYAGAQMPFTGAPLSSANSFGRGAYPQPANNPPPVAPGTMPNAMYGMPTNAYPGVAMSSEPIDPDHKLSRGDRLSYRVVEDRDDKVIPLVVTDSGEVDIPLINRVKAQGKTTQQLTSDIKARLEQEYYYHATVVLGLDSVPLRASRGTVYVGGKGIATGSVELPLDAPMTVSQAISKMGGFKEFGKDTAVRVLRKGGPPKGYVINVHDVMRGATDKDFVLQPGDTIVVDENKFGLQF